MRILNLIFGCFFVFLFMFLLVYVYAIVAASTVSAEEDFFLVFISEKDKKVEVVNKNSSMKSCQKNTEKFILDSFDSLQKKEKKGKIKICCINKKQTKHSCLDLGKSLALRW